MAVSQARHLCGSQLPVSMTGMYAYAWTSTPNQSKVMQTYLQGWPCGSVAVLAGQDSAEALRPARQRPVAAR